MNKTIIKNIIFFILIYSFNLWAIEHYNSPEEKCIHCNDSYLIKLIVDLKKQCISKINYIPDRAKKIVAGGVVHTYELCTLAKKNITDGVQYITSMINACIHWAYDNNDE